MSILEFVILLSVLIWIGISLNRPRPVVGWKYTLVNIAGYEDVEKCLDEKGRWGRELVLIWSPPDLDPNSHIYAIFKESVPYGR